MMQDQEAFHPLERPRPRRHHHPTNNRSEQRQLIHTAGSDAPNRAAARQAGLELPPGSTSANRLLAPGVNSIQPLVRLLSRLHEL
jgi:hypothetical protein